MSSPSTVKMTDSSIATSEGSPEVGLYAIDACSDFGVTSFAIWQGVMVEVVAQWSGGINGGIYGLRGGGIWCYWFRRKLSLTIRLRARVFYEQIVNEAQPSWLSLVENEGE